MGELFAFPRIENASMDRVPLDGVEREKSLLAAGDLLFARQSLVLEGAGKCSIFVDDLEPVTFESHIIRARLNRDVADPDFYFYFFTSHEGRARIRSIVEQVAAAGIRGRDLALLPVPVPPLRLQREVGRVLRALDDKIELHRRMNRTLESIARAVFESWFVDFDPVRKRMASTEVERPSDVADLFPDSLEPSVLGPIPRGWEWLPLGECAQVVKGRSYKGSELAPSDTALVTLKSFHRNGGYRDDGLKDYTGPFKAEQGVEAGDVLVAHTDVTQAAEVLGRAVRVRGSARHKALVASLDTAIVRPLRAGLSREFLYFALDSQRFRDHAYGYCNGTTVLHLSAKALPEYYLAVPPPDLVSRFSRVARPMLHRSDLLASECETLAAVRDRLLPGLMTGALVPSGSARVAGSAEV